MYASRCRGYFWTGMPWRNHLAWGETLNAVRATPPPFRWSARVLTPNRPC
jgi:hypothetical protein